MSLQTLEQDLDKKQSLRKHAKEYRNRPEVKARIKEWSKKYYQKPEVKAHKKAMEITYRQKPEVKAHKKAMMKEYQQRPEVKARLIKYLQKWHRYNAPIMKYETLHHYSKLMCCVRCGYSDIRALSIDHINGDGAKHRKEHGTSRMMYRWLRDNDYPEGYQVLCMNCQFIKRDENHEYAKSRKT